MTNVPSCSLIFLISSVSVTIATSCNSNCDKFSQKCIISIEVLYVQKYCTFVTMTPAPTSTPTPTSTSAETVTNSPTTVTMSDSTASKGVAGRINYGQWDKVATSLVDDLEKETQEEIEDQAAKVHMRITSYCYAVVSSCKS